MSLPPHAKQNLTTAQKELQRKFVYSNLEARIKVRRRTASSRFQSEDLLLEIQFKQLPSIKEDVPLLLTLTTVEEALNQVIVLLREYFDDALERVVFFSIEIKDTTTVPLYLGGRSLHADNEIVNVMMRKLYHFLTSNLSAKLKNGLLVKASIFSLDHSQDYLQRKGRQGKSKKKTYKVGKKKEDFKAYEDAAEQSSGSSRSLRVPKPPQHPFPSGLVGHRSIKTAKTCRKIGLLTLGEGFPDQPQIFSQSCLVLSFVAALKLSQAYEQSLNQGKAMLKYFRQLTSPKSSKKSKNEVGYFLLKEAKQVLSKTSINFTGPHSYDCLNVLSQSENVNTVVYSQYSQNMPLFVFPANQSQKICPSKPTIYLYETANLRRNSQAQHHLDVIVSPEQLFGKSGFGCRLCLKPVHHAQRHLR